MADADLSFLTGWMREFARVIGENAQFLTDLDSSIGDADHGINMDRGMTAVLGALDESAPADMPALCKQVGMTLVKSVGGASGPLYGTFFLRMAGALGTGESVGAAMQPNPWSPARVAPVTSDSAVSVTSIRARHRRQC